MTRTVGTLFSGGELFGIGASWAGYFPLWGIEHDDKVAQVARLNGFPVITGDVRSVDNYNSLERPNHLHASPPCPNFSTAKNGGEETKTDVALAEAVCWFLTRKKPETFTMENVPAYIHSESFKRIANTLSELGYWWDVNNLNAADFGVPQTRRRLWVRASRQLLRGYPPPVKWVGWYEAIADLIPSLPDTEFAPWQKARLPEEYMEYMIDNGLFMEFKFRGRNIRKSNSFIVGQGTYSPALPPNDPLQTITANNNQSAIKAFIVGEQNGQVSDDTRPAYTVQTGQKPKAFILDGQANEGERVTLRQGDEPIFTQTASGSKRPARAYANGRVVKMTVQALGRFQSVPDSYKGLTIKINGNGVPCLLAQRVLETLS